MAGGGVGGGEGGEGVGCTLLVTVGLDRKKSVFFCVHVILVLIVQQTSSIFSVANY